jgi:thioredoxin reductase
VSGEELLGRLAEQLERYGVQRSAAPVTSLRGTTGEFSVNSSVRACRVLLATGVEDSMPGDLELGCCRGVRMACARRDFW